ncbi:hypothetical protein [Butyrivibrio sp. WCE2006]|uniref:hypothetical protein n=1 Tax=Butyrivibrio sp. WCE2006 TaxID=1410611 RepID=UPI0012DBEADB
MEEVHNWRRGNTIAGHFARDEISLLDIDDLEIRNKLIEVIEWEELDEVKLETS